MKRILMFLFVLAAVPMLSAQLPNRVKKLEGLWEYREGSGYERWRTEGEVMFGESFRVNKLGDTLVAEQFEIRYINKRLVLNLKAYHIVGDSLAMKERTLIGKRRKMEFSNTSSIGIKTMHFKLGFFSKKRLKLFVYYEGIEAPQKLRLTKRENELR